MSHLNTCTDSGRAAYALMWGTPAESWLAAEWSLLFVLLSVGDFSFKLHQSSEPNLSCCFFTFSLRLSSTCFPAAVVNCDRKVYEMCFVSILFHNRHKFSSCPYSAITR